MTEPPLILPVLVAGLFAVMSITALFVFRRTKRQLWLIPAIILGLMAVLILFGD